MNYGQRVIVRHGTQEEQLKFRAKKFIDDLEPTEDKSFEIIIKKHQTSKTLEQLGYYWGVIIPYLMDWSGNTKDECDQILKHKLVPPQEFQFDDVVYEIRPSIAKMKVKEMSSYIDQCIIYLAGEGCAIPHPHYKGVVK